MPGSPPTRTALPGTIPPPRMRSNSPMPVGVRGASSDRSRESRSGSAPGSGRRSHCRRWPRASGVGGFVFLQPIPRAAVRALAHPLRMNAATAVAEELGLRFRHQDAAQQVVILTQIYRNVSLVPGNRLEAFPIPRRENMLRLLRVVAPIRTPRPTTPKDIEHYPNNQ